MGRQQGKKKVAADGDSSEYMSDEELIDWLLLTDVHVSTLSEYLRASLFLHSWPTKLFSLTRPQVMTLLTNAEETKAKLKVLLAQPKLKSYLYDLLNEGEYYGQSFAKYRDTLNLIVEALFSENFDSWVSNYQRGLLDHSSTQKSRQNPHEVEGKKDAWYEQIANTTNGIRDICDSNEREPLSQNDNMTFRSNCNICENIAAPSSEEKDYFSRLPQQLQLKILKYLDRDSLIACSQASRNWEVTTEILLREMYPLSDIPNCRYFEYDCYHPWIQRILTYYGTIQNWTRSYQFERDIEIIVLRGYDVNSYVRETSECEILKYREWVIINIGLKKIYVLDLQKFSRLSNPGSIEYGEEISKIVVFPVTNQPGFLIAGTKHGSICIRKMDKPGFPLVHNLKRHESAITGFAINASTLRLQASGEQYQFVSCSSDCTVRLWDALTGECVRVYKEHERSVQCVAFFEEWIASADDEGNVLIRDTDGNRIRHLQKCDPNPRGLEYNKKYLVYNSSTSINIFNFQNPANDKIIKIDCPDVIVDFKSGQIFCQNEHELSVYNMETQRKSYFRRGRIC
ncbi:hypothetical protein ACTXT7_013850 [Hymenolepis weldensis]